MPEKVTVWMVHLERAGDLHDIEGELDMDDDAVVFRHRTTPAELRFPFPAIRRVRRVMGSPVFVLEWSASTETSTEGRRGSGDARRTAFYFAKPPPLDSPMDAKPAAGTRAPDELPRPSLREGLGGVGGLGGRRRHRRRNVGYLTVRSSTMKPLVKAWCDEISAQVGRR